MSDFVVKKNLKTKEIYKFNNGTAFFYMKISRIL